MGEKIQSLRQRATIFFLRFFGKTLSTKNYHTSYFVLRKKSWQFNDCRYNLANGIIPSK